MWVEYFVYAYNKDLTAGNGTVFEDGTIRIDSDADFEAHKQTYWATSGNVRITMRDDSMGRYLIKNPTDLRTIAGNFAGTPFVLSRPLAFQAGSNIIISMADNSTMANTVRLAFQGGKRRPGVPPDKYKYRAIYPFIYSLNRQTVTASSTAYYNIEIDTDAHFLVQRMTGHREGNCLVSIRESARDRDWQNTATHFDNFFGNGQFPNIMFSNRFIYRGSVVTIQVQDLSGFANTIDVNLIGVKCYE